MFVGKHIFMVVFPVKHSKIWKKVEKRQCLSPIIFPNDQQSLSLYLLKKTKFLSVCNKGFLHLALIDENAHNFVTVRISSKFPFSLSPNRVKLFIITQYLVTRRFSSSSDVCFFFAVDFTYLSTKTCDDKNVYLLKYVKFFQEPLPVLLHESAGKNRFSRVMIKI